VSSRALIAALVAALAALLLLVPEPQEAQAVPSPCDLPLVGGGCEVVQDVLGGAADAAAEAAADAILGTLTGWVGDGASWLLRQVATAIDTTTDVDLGARWFQEHYDFMFGVGAILLLPLLLLSVLQALLRQDLGLLVRSPLLYLPAAMLLTGLAVAVTQTALAVTDSLSAELSAGIAEDTGSLAEGLARVSAAGAGVPLFAAFVMALFMALAAAFVWFELVLRAAAVYITVMFLPLFLAAMVWPATSQWIRRLVQLLVAAVLSKLVIVATLSLGLSAFSSGESPSAVFAGAGMFLLAAFSPFVLFSLIPLVADAAQPQRESRQAVASATGTALAWNVARTRMAFGVGHGPLRRIGPGGPSGRSGIGGRGQGGAPPVIGPPRGGGGGGPSGGPVPVGPAPRGGRGGPAPSAAPSMGSAPAGTPRSSGAGVSESGGGGAPEPRRRPRTPPPTLPTTPRGRHGA
jgi:hypothetical protein